MQQIILLVIFAAAVLPAGVVAQQKPLMPEDLQWQNRVLLIFANSSASVDYRRQLKLWDQVEEGMRERDLVVYHLFREGGSYTGGQVLPDGRVRELFRSYGVTVPPATTLLIGKDGTEKLRVEAPLDTAALFEVIDAMPMRRREMRNDEGNRH